MYRLIFSTMDPRAARQLAQAAKGIQGVALEHRGELNLGPSIPERHQRARDIYQDYATGASAKAVALRHGVSVQTVSRIALDPGRYGIKAPAIRRRG